MVKVTKRIDDPQKKGSWAYEYVGEFKSYADAIRHFNGEQRWYDVKLHRFVKDGVLYLMTKLKNK